VVVDEKYNGRLAGALAGSAPGVSAV